MNFISSLEKAFKENSNAENAIAMSKYMKNNFAFFGIKTEERRRIFKAIWAANQKEVSENTREIALELYSKTGTRIALLCHRNLGQKSQKQV